MPTRTTMSPQVRGSRYQGITPILLGLACILLAANLIKNSFFSPVQQPPQPVQQPQVIPTEIPQASTGFVIVPVPKNRITPGTRLSDIDFKNVELESKSIGSNVIRDATNFAEYFVLKTLIENEPIEIEYLTKRVLDASEIKRRIPRGLRALAIDMPSSSRAGGWINPGSFIDVTLTTSKESIVIADRVQVLAVDNSTSAQAGTHGSANTVTLLVTQQQALSLTTAKREGSLEFMLRNDDDKAGWDKDKRNMSREDLGAKQEENYKGTVVVRGPNGEQRLIRLNDRDQIISVGERKDELVFGGQEDKNTQNPEEVQ